VLARRDEAFELFGGEWSLRARLFVAVRTAAHPFAGALLLAGVAALVVADQLEPSDEWPSVLTPAALRAVTVVGAVMVLGNLYYAVDAAFLD
jgi:hypothetical protein